MNYKIIADTPMGTVIIGWCNKGALPLHGFSSLGYVNVRIEKIEPKSESMDRAGHGTDQQTTDTAENQEPDRF